MNNFMVFLLQICELYSAAVFVWSSFVSELFSGNSKPPPNLLNIYQRIEITGSLCLWLDLVLLLRPSCDRQHGLFLLACFK